MASSVNFKDEVARRLECNICMDRLRAPKDLKCHHTFCKDCLDGILKFRKDGSAVIRCPLRCSEHTFIPNNKTTNDLGTPFHLKGILEMFDDNAASSVDPNKKALCQQSSSCGNSLSIYCSTCSLMLCQACRQTHDAEHETNIYVPVRFHEKDGKIKIICCKHSTFAKYVCCESDFICVYCKHRNHRGHEHQAIEMRTKHIKGSLTTRMNSMAKMNNLVQKSLIATESGITDCRKRLTNSLKTRKLMCLSKYLMLLNKSEEKILNEYDSLTAKQILHYSAPNSAEYYNSLNKYDGIKLLVDGESLIDNILHSHSVNMAIPSLSIKLKEAEHSDRKPLGTLEVEKGENILISEAELSSSFIYDIHQSELSQQNISSLIEVLRGLMGEALQRREDQFITNLNEDMVETREENKSNKGDADAVDRASSSANVSKEEKKLQKLASKEIVKQFKKQGINYVYELVKENDEESMALLLSAKDGICKLRGPFGSTPLLTAARYNRVAMLKLLLDHGSSLEEKGSNESTVLHISSFHGSHAALEWLLNKCHHLIDDTNKTEKRTALQYAISNGHLRCMHLLLKKGADINIKDKDGFTAMDIAKEAGSETCVDELQLALLQRGELDQGKYAEYTSVQEYKKKCKLV